MCIRDSVSPAANLCWYGVPGEKKDNDVTKVEETWWYRFIHEHGFQLERNNSYSGIASASWEVDIFGKLTNAKRRSKADVYKRQPLRP